MSQVNQNQRRGWKHVVTTKEAREKSKHLLSAWRSYLPCAVESCEKNIQGPVADEDPCQLSFRSRPHPNTLSRPSEHHVVVRMPHQPLDGARRSLQRAHVLSGGHLPHLDSAVQRSSRYIPVSHRNAGDTVIQKRDWDTFINTSDIEHV